MTDYEDIVYMVDRGVATLTINRPQKLVNKVVPAGELDAEVRRWCDEILAMSPTALAIAKRSFNADSENIAGIGQLGFQALKMYYETAESKEGVQAFLEKRKPDFRKF